MNYTRRNSCQRAALVLALVSLSSTMMLPGLSLSRAAGVRTTPARSQPAASSIVGMRAGAGATTIRRSLHGEVNSVTCFDPVPNPINAGWTKEGNGSFQPGTPLGVTDPSANPGDFINFFCADSALFSGDVVLTLRVTPAQAGQITGPSGTTGIHASINDGSKIIRAVILTIGASYRVVLALAGGGFSNGFIFTGTTLDFGLRRNAGDGSATLSVTNPVPGGPPLEETVLAVDLTDSPRRGIKTVEFGTYDVPAASSANWDTLGLTRNIDFPIGLTVDEMRLKDDNSDKVRFRAAFTLGAGSDGINPVSESVTLMMTNANGQFYSANLPAGSFELKRNDRAVRWALTDAARQSTGIERFDILLDNKEIFFVDRQTTLPSGSFANVSLTLVIGNDSGTGSVMLVERPPGSGRWSLR